MRSLDIFRGPTIGTKVSSGTLCLRLEEDILIALMMPKDSCPSFQMLEARVCVLHGGGVVQASHVMVPSLEWPESQWHNQVDWGLAALWRWSLHTLALSQTPPPHTDDNHRRLEVSSLAPKKYPSLEDRSRNAAAGHLWRTARRANGAICVFEVRRSLSLTHFGPRLGSFFCCQTRTLPSQTTAPSMAQKMSC